jgi:pimeloyl-ACP methyl ester carboxylesterase
MVVWGEKDRLQHVKHAKRYLRYIPHATLHLHPDTGHFPQLEQPARFNADLAGFIAGLAATRGRTPPPKEHR